MSESDIRPLQRFCKLAYRRLALAIRKVTPREEYISDCVSHHLRSAGVAGSSGGRVEGSDPSTGGPSLDLRATTHFSPAPPNPDPLPPAHHFTEPIMIAMVAILGFIALAIAVYFLFKCIKGTFL